MKTRIGRRRASIAWSLALSSGLAIAATCSSAVLAQTPTIEVKSVILKLIQRVEVPAHQAGALTSIQVAEGQIVKTGEVLARIDDEEARLLHQKAELELQIARRRAENDAEIRSAEEELVVLEQDLRRAEQSREKFPQSVPQSEYDHLKLKTLQSRFQIQRLRHEQEVAKATCELRATDLQFARQNLQRRQILSPLDGVVVEIHQAPGEWVEPGEKILRVVRLDRLRAEGFIDARDTRESLVGRGVTLKVDLPGQEATSHRGVVVFVSPEVDPVNRQTRIWAEIENGGLKLQPGLRGQMTVAGPRP